MFLYLIWESLHFLELFHHKMYNKTYKVESVGLIGFRKKKKIKFIRFLYKLQKMCEYNS